MPDPYWNQYYRQDSQAVEPPASGQAQDEAQAPETSVSDAAGGTGADDDIPQFSSKPRDQTVSTPGSGQPQDEASAQDGAPAPDTPVVPDTSVSDVPGVPPLQPPMSVQERLARIIRGAPSASLLGENAVRPTGARDAVAPADGGSMSAMQRAILSGILANTMQRPSTVAEGLSGIARAALLKKFVSPSMLRDEVAAPQKYFNVGGGLFALNPDGTARTVVPRPPPRPGTRINIGGDGGDVGQKAVKQAVGNMFADIIKKTTAWRQQLRLLRSMEFTLGNADTGSGVMTEARRWLRQIGFYQDVQSKTLDGLIREYMAATRVPGMGDMSERELEIAMEALPSETAYPVQNLTLVKILERLIEHRLRAGNILAAWAQGEKGSSDRLLRLLKDEGYDAEKYRGIVIPPDEMHQIMGEVSSNRGMPVLTPADIDALRAVAARHAKAKTLLKSLDNLEVGYGRAKFSPLSDRSGWYRRKR